MSPDEGRAEGPPPHVGEAEPCSAKGCQAPAAWALLWNNPRLHTPERRKVWLACPEHRGQLDDFLTARAFLREVVPHAPGQGHGPG